MEHAINQQVFEITCSSEEGAARLRSELAHYTASRINSVLQSVLDQSVPAQQTVVIDRLEIDLGDLSEEEFGADELLARFRNALTDEIVRHSQPSPLMPLPAGRTGKKALSNSFELTTRFIRTGDLPWWADKSVAMELDTCLRELIRQEPERLRKFLQTVRDDRDALLRIARQFKPSTRKELQEVMPDLFSRRELSLGILSGEAGSPGANTGWLTEELVELWEQFTGTDGQVKTEKHKARLARKIARSLLSAPRFSESLSWLPAVSGERTSGKQSDKKERFRLLMALSLSRLQLLQLYLDYLNDSGFATTEGAPPLQSTSGTRASAERKAQIFPAGPGAEQPASADSSPDPATSRSDLIAASGKHIVGKDVDAHEEDRLISSTGEVAATSSNETAEITSPQNAPSTAENTFTDTNHPTVPDKRYSADFDPARSGEGTPFTNHTGNLVFDQPAAPSTSTGKRADQPREAQAVQSAMPPQEGTGSGLLSRIPPPPKKQIAVIAGLLDNTDPAFTEYLQSLSPAVLRSLAKSFRAEKKQAVQMRKAVEELMEHPLLLQYRTILLAATLPFAQEAGLSPASIPEKQQTLLQRRASRLLIRLHSAQTQLVHNLQALPVKQALILRHIFQQRHLQGADEQRHLRNFLRRLPEPAIQLLQFLTQLPETVLRDLQQAENRQATTDRLSTRDPLLMATEEGPQKFYLVNGGLCLVAPYLPGLFSQLGYLENRAFKNNFYAVRALHALHYLATGSRKAPEYQLLFNKLLCGLPPEHAPGFNIRLTKKETAEIDDCLVAVIANWKALKNTSPQGFRESFLRRNAILSEKESAWTLQVERKDYDLLLNTLPWNFSMIKLAWMKKMIQVEWQN